MPKDLRSTTLFRTADALAELVFRATSGWPASMQHTLGAQLRRAALSVPCNLAEATSRRSAKERHRFVEIADGSLREARYVIELAARLGAFDGATGARLRDLATRATALLASQRSRAGRKAGITRRRARRGPARQATLDLAGAGG